MIITILFCRTFNCIFGCGIKISSIYFPAEDSYLLLKFLGQEIPNQLRKSRFKIPEIGSGSGILLETAKRLGIKQEHILEWT